MSIAGKSVKLLGQARLHSTISGSAQNDRRRPVLLVHGAYHGAWCWDKWVDRLAEDGRQVHALDLRGHGGLEPDAAFVTAGVAEMVQDVVMAIDAIPGRPVVVGHSLGGLIVALAAQQRDVAGLLLVCPSPSGNLPGAAKVPMVAEDALCPPLNAEQVGVRYAPHLDEAELSALAEQICAESPRLLNQRYDLRIPVDPQAFDRDLPILVVEGGRDDPARHPPGQDAAIAAFYGGSHLRLDDAPHNLMLGPGWRGWFKAIWHDFDDML
ncbi:MAG: alpha/beta fold hydrolase [Thalassobaculaceae bacterium]|nr:alpha/beta fold hydrolase [Thalassobaculaceae bacterium]